MRISTTTLESYRLWSQPENDWFDEADLIATIKGEFHPTPAVLLGRAFGQVLEKPQAYREADGGYRCEGFHFREEIMAQPLALMDRRGVFEAKGVKRYGDCDVVAKADQIIGCRLIEHKATLGSFDFDKYADSYQWRFMADIFEPMWITYHVFCLSDYHGPIELRNVETFNLYPYDELHQDCCALVEQFKGYVTTRGLDGLLRARQEAA